MRQGQEAVPRDGNDSALVLSLVERHHEIDRCLQRFVMWIGKPMSLAWLFQQG